MGKLLKTYILPHPPVMVHEVGRGEEEKVEKTVKAAMEVAEEISNLKPDTIVIVVPPHGPAFGDAVSINTDSVLKGSLANFRADEVRFDYEVDLALTSSIIRNCTQNKISIAPLDGDASKSYGIPGGLDHGSMVPLYFIEKIHKKFRIVHITYGFLSNEELYYFGKVIRESIEECDSNVVLITSGDLSHRLTPDAPAGFAPMAARFDELLVEYLKKPDADGIIEMDRMLVDAAGECGYRSIIIMLGALDGLDVKGRVLSYEGPFGVGYCVASYDIIGVSEEKKRVDLYFARRHERAREIREKEDQYVRLARMSLENCVKTGKKISTPQELPEEMLKEKAGAFVSIKKNGQLRGCIGTIEPTRDSIACEIIQNAVSAGIEDPRFYPVEEDELDDLVYSVDILGKPEPVDENSGLDPKRYGVIVRKGGRSGLLLPNLEGVDTVKEQLDIVLRKAGIGCDEEYSMERFEVIRHK